MQMSQTPWLPRRWSIGRRSVTVLAITTAALIAIVGSFAWRGAPVAAQSAGELQGLGIVTGTVTAGKPFTAAHVYLRSTDRRRSMLYMVYTQAGGFKTVAVMPGNYELVAKARGLESDPQPIVVRSGTNPAVKVAMRDAKDPNQYPTSVDPSEARSSQRCPAAAASDHLCQLRRALPGGPGSRRPREPLHAVPRGELLCDEPAQPARMEVQPRQDDGHQPPRPRPAVAR